jgi:hypothetical protein
MSLGCSKTDEFCSGKGESGCHKDVAEAFESIVEGSWVCPVFTTNVARVWTSAAIDYYPEYSVASISACSNY